MHYIKLLPASANFVEVTLTSKDIKFTPEHKERLKTALSVLKITWSNEEDEYDEDEEDEVDEDRF